MDSDGCFPADNWRRLQRPPSVMAITRCTAVDHARMSVWTAMGCLFAPCVVLCITRHLLSQPNITSSSEGSSDSHGTLSEVHGNLNPNPQTSKPTTPNPTPTILCLFTGPHRRTSSWGNLYPAVVGCTQLAHIDIYSCVCLFIRHDM